MAFGATAGLVLAGLGAGVSAIGTFMQARSASAMASYQAAVAQNNKIIAERNAQYELEAGQRAEEAHRLKVGGLLAQQKVSQAANGIDIGSGSALDVRRSTEVLAELDAQTIRNNTIRKANDYRNQAMNFEAQSGLYQMSSRASALEGWIGAVGNIIGGASNVADKWMAYKQVGLLA